MVIYKIIVDVKTRLPRPKEVAVVTFIVAFVALLLQKFWRISWIASFGPGKPGVLFKCPANIYTFHETVILSVAFHAEQVKTLEHICHLPIKMTLKISPKLTDRLP